jgi:ABC-type dipeptide/oligopeptide/nickel transport system permease component
MKIFSLQSKTSLVAWSVVLGVLITTGLYVKNLVDRPVLCYNIPGVNCFETEERIDKYYNTDYGWPIKFFKYNENHASIEIGPIFYNQVLKYSFIFNTLFWFLVIAIVLSLLRYFRNKNKPTS